MFIKDINIISFGKLKNKKITFTDSFNVIYGRNESGKTTISAFIEAMLYSFPPRSDRSKCLPWDNSTAAGEMTISVSGKSLTFYRKFGTQPKGDVLEPKDFSLKDLIPPGREAYRKSIYSPEGALGDFGTTGDLDIIISNLLAGGDETVSAEGAIKSLEKLRRSLNSGGKKKEYDQKISLLEDEYAAASIAMRKNESTRRLIEEKKKLIATLEAEAKGAESSQEANLKESIKKLDDEIREQASHVANFPAFDKKMPQEPSFMMPSLILYSLCTTLLIVAGFFTHWALFPLAALPLIAYLILFLFKKKTYKADLKAFLHSFGCSSMEEYERLLSDFEGAREYYNTLLEKKSALITSFSESNASSADIIYKKILALKYETEELEASTVTNLRELVAIEEELEYYRRLHRELSDKLEAIRIAIEGINHAKGVIATDFTPKVTAIAEGYINRIAPKEGRSVSLSKDMTLTVSDGAHRNFAAHSFGFKEEMYLCFRIAWSEFLFGKDFPLILDDPFTGSDDYREKALIDLLYSLSEDRQIIIFTNRRNDYFGQLNCNWVDICPLNDV